VTAWPEFHLAALLRRLDAAGVEFVVVGGIAAIAHGSPRFTFDLDIVFATDESNLRSLSDALSALNAKLHGVIDEVPFVPDARALRQVRLLCLNTDEGRLDHGPAGWL
jgi:hypothetical protein